MKKEIWKHIDGCDGYIISSLGRVKSLQRKVKKWNGERLIPERILRPQDRAGYKLVFIRKKGYLIHRLVAMAFISNPLNKPCVNHINGVKHDNSIENLEWVTYSENEKHSYSVLGKKPNLTNLGNTGILSIESCPVIAYMHKKQVGVYCSLTEAAQKLCLFRANISKVLLKHRNHTGGYTFKRISRKKYFEYYPTKLAEYKKLYL